MLAASGTTVSDAALLERFLSQHDEAAFELLVRRHERMVLGVCRRVLGHVQDAEDAFQAAFLMLARKAGSVRKREALASWLYKVAFRIALQARARNQARARHERPLGHTLATWAATNLASPADGSALRDLLDEAIHRLPRKYRAPVILCYLEGKTNEQAALQLGCPTGTVVTHLARARQWLRKDLVRRGLDFSVASLPIALASSSTAPAVRADLIDSTLQAALVFASQRADLPSLVSANVALLTKGAIRGMFLTKLKLVAAVLLSLGVVGAGAGVWSYRSWGLLGAEAAPDQPLQGTGPPARGKATDAPKAKSDQTGVQREREPQVSQHWFVRSEGVRKSFKSSRTPHLIVDLFNGGIKLTADSGDRVEVLVTKEGSGDSEESALAAVRNIDLQMAQEDDSIRVTAKRLEEAKKTQSIASAEVRVPPGAMVDLHTRNGAVSLQGGTGKANVQTSNGAIDIKNHKGSLELRTSNGAITIVGGTGSMELNTSNGAISINADPAELKSADLERLHSFPRQAGACRALL